MTTKDDGSPDDSAALDLDDTPEMKRLLEMIRTSKVAQEKLRRIFAPYLTGEHLISTENLEGDGEKGE